MPEHRATAGNRRALVHYRFNRPELLNRERLFDPPETDRAFRLVHAYKRLWAQKVGFIASTDLASVISKRSRLMETLVGTEKEIAQSKRLVVGIHAYVDETEESDYVGRTGEFVDLPPAANLRCAANGQR